jgi:hypothetical protein
MTSQSLPATDEPMSFIEYWDAVDAALKKFFSIDTWDAGIEPSLLARCQEGGETPEEFALWFGEKYGLTLLSEWSR